MASEEETLRQQILDLIAKGARSFLLTADVYACLKAGVPLHTMHQRLVGRDEGPWRFTSVLGEAFHKYGPCPACEELNAAKQRPRSDPDWLDPLACSYHLNYQFLHRHESPPPRTVHGEPVWVR